MPYIVDKYTYEKIVFFSDYLTFLNCTQMWDVEKRVYDNQIKMKLAIFFLRLTVWIRCILENMASLNSKNCRKGIRIAIYSNFGIGLF